MEDEGGYPDRRKYLRDIGLLGGLDQRARHGGACAGALVDGPEAFTEFATHARGEDVSEAPFAPMRNDVVKRGDHMLVLSGPNASFLQGFFRRTPDGVGAVNDQSARSLGPGGREQGASEPAFRKA